MIHNQEAYRNINDTMYRNINGTVDGSFASLGEKMNIFTEGFSMQSERNDATHSFYPPSLRKPYLFYHLHSYTPIDSANIVVGLILLRRQSFVIWLSLHK